MALKQVFYGNSNIVVTAGELYNLNCQVVISNDQVMSFIQRIYPCIDGKSFDDLIDVVYVDSDSPKGTVIDIKANYIATENGNVNAGLVIETDQLEDSVDLVLDNFEARGPVCISPFPINDYNFIRWNNSSNVKFPLDYPIRRCGNEELLVPGLQRPTEIIDCEVYKPVFRNDEEYSVFTNFIESYAFEPTGSLRIGFIKDGAPTVSESFAVTKLDLNIAGTDYDFLYATFTPIALTDGKYRLVVYDDTTDVIYLISNEIIVDNNLNVLTTALVKYRNNDDIDGFQYLELEDFYNQIRINIFRDQPRETEPDYEDENQVATAEHRYISLAHRLALPVVADQFDDYACNALESMLAHSEVYINGKRYNTKPDVDYEQSDETHNLFDGRFTVYDYSYARKNKYR